MSSYTNAITFDVRLICRALDIPYFLDIFVFDPWSMGHDQLPCLLICVYGFSMVVSRFILLATIGVSSRRSNHTKTHCLKQFSNHMLCFFGFYYNAC